MGPRRSLEKLRQLKEGDTIIQALSGYPVVESFTILEILEENKTEIKVVALFLGDPSGVYVEHVKKKYLECEYYHAMGLNGQVRSMRTQIL